MPTRILDTAVKPALRRRGWHYAPRPARRRSSPALADAQSGYAVAVHAQRQGLLHRKLAPGLYRAPTWGPVSSSGCNEIIEVVMMPGCSTQGPMFTDYSTVGHQMVVVDGGAQDDRRPSGHPVFIGGRVLHQRAHVRRSSPRLAKSREASTPTVIAGGNSSASARKSVPPAGRRRRSPDHAAAVRPRPEGCSQRMTFPFHRRDRRFLVQRHATEIAGRRPAFEIQMQYGSIGWSVGAALGYAAGSRASA